MLNTLTLKNNLEHCIGRKTVQVIDDVVYHYGSPILKVNYAENEITMTHYYDYSASTSRVRNAALNLLGLPSILTKNLRKAENNGECIGCGVWVIKFE